MENTKRNNHKSMNVDHGIRNHPLWDVPASEKPQLHAGIVTKIHLPVNEEELAMAESLVKDYSPDFDQITATRYTIPYQWEVDFGNGWTVSIDVVEPEADLAPYCEAVLYRNGEIVHRSVRESEIRGIWGLRYDNILFQVDIQRLCLQEPLF